MCTLLWLNMKNIYFASLEKVSKIPKIVVYTGLGEYTEKQFPKLCAKVPWAANFQGLLKGSTGVQHHGTLCRLPLAYFQFHCCDCVMFPLIVRISA